MKRRTLMRGLMAVLLIAAVALTVHVLHKDAEAVIPFSLTFNWSNYGQCSDTQITSVTVEYLNNLNVVVDQTTLSYSWSNFPESFWSTWDAPDPRTVTVRITPHSNTLDFAPVSVSAAINWVNGNALGPISPE